MDDPQYINRRVATKSYRPKGYMMSPGLLRAREPYRVKNAVTGVVISSFVVGAWLYSLNAVKQDTFDDVDEEARALVGSGTKSLEDEAREREVARKAAAAAGAAPVAPAAVSSPSGVGRARGRGGLLLPLDETFPRLLDPDGKTLVWGAPPVDRVGTLGDGKTRR